MPVGAASWSFTQEQHDAAAAALRRFLADSGAACALLVERAGQLVTAVGEPPRSDVTTLATLAAADFSANEQLARLVGAHDFRSLVHRGERECVLLAGVARRLVLVVLFDAARAAEGLVRLRARGVVEELDGRVARMEQDAAAAPAAPPFADADDEIDRLFPSFP